MYRLCGLVSFTTTQFRKTYETIARNQLGCNLTQEELAVLSKGQGHCDDVARRYYVHEDAKARVAESLRIFSKISRNYDDDAKPVKRQKIIQVIDLVDDEKAMDKVNDENDVTPIHTPVQNQTSENHVILQSPVPWYDAAPSEPEHDRKKKTPWTSTEDNALQEALQTYGHGAWKAIHTAIQQNIHPKRTTVDVKDRVRTLGRQNERRFLCELNGDLSKQSFVPAAKPKQKRIKFTDAEDKAIADGYAEFHEVCNTWKSILNRYVDVFHDSRTPQSLRSRARLALFKKKYPNVILETSSLTRSNN